MMNRRVAVALPVLLASVVVGSAPLAGTHVNDPREAIPAPFRISHMGPDGSSAYGASTPAVAYNPNANEFLVVWAGEHQNDGELEIYGQRIDAATGLEIGPNDFRISNVGADGNTARLARDPTVAFNPARNEYLVAWEGNDNPDPQWVEDFDVYGQRLAADGTPIGNDYMLSDTPLVAFMGSCFFPFQTLCRPTQWWAHSPALAYDAQRGDYVLAHVRVGPNNDRAYLEYVVLVRLSASGVPGTRTFTTGTIFHSGSSMRHLTLMRNPAADDYLVVFRQQGWWTYEGHIHAMRVNGALSQWSTATEISQMATTADEPHAVYNPARNEYLVVWSGVHGTFAGGRRQIFGQRLSATGAAIGANDFHISDASTSYSGITPSVVYDSAKREYVVVWDGELQDRSRRVLAQRLSATGDEVGDNDFALTPAGYGTATPAIAHSGTSRKHLTVWTGIAPTLGAGETEVFGVRLSTSTATALVVGPGRGGAGESRLWELESGVVQTQSTVTLPWPHYSDLNGEIHPALGDVDGDGLDEIVVGLGHGSDGWLAIFDDAQHGNALLRWIQVPWPSYNAANGTTWPAVGDLDGDDKAEIVVGLGAGAEGYYAIFDDASNGYALLTWRRVNWAWFNETQSGETHPAIVNADGGAARELVIGLGPGGAGWLELVNNATASYAHMRWLRVGWSFYNGGPGETYPAAGDVDGDGADEIVVGLGRNSQGWVQVFDDAATAFAHKGWLRVNWTDYNNTSGETHPAVGDVDGDAAEEVVLGLGPFAFQGGWIEMRDDFAGGFVSLGWRTAATDAAVAAGVATFPAIGRSH